MRIRILFLLTALIFPISAAWGDERIARIDKEPPSVYLQTQLDGYLSRSYQRHQ